MPEENQSPPARPRRRYWQFSLRTLLVLIAVLAVWLGWWTQGARGQRQAAEALRKLGVTVAYDFEWNREQEYLEKPEPSGPAWLRGFLGIDYFADVVIVNAGDCPLHDEDLALLEQFPRLQYLNLTGTLIGDDGCRHFAGLKHLAAVHLGHTKVTDAGLKHFEGLTDLGWTFLGHTQITDEGVKHLAGLAKLRELNVFGTRVTGGGHSAPAPVKPRASRNLRGGSSDGC